MATEAEAIAHDDVLSCFHCDKEVRFYRVLDFRDGRKRSNAVPNEEES